MQQIGTKKLSITNGTKIPTFDPRSPTNEYNRTPIHVSQRNTDTNTIENESNSLNASLNVSVNSFSLDSSSMAASDSSMLLQQSKLNIIQFLCVNIYLFFI